MTESCSFLVMLPIMTHEWDLWATVSFIKALQMSKGYSPTWITICLIQMGIKLFSGAFELTNWSVAENFFNCPEGIFFKTIQCLILVSLLLPAGFGPSQL